MSEEESQSAVRQAHRESKPPQLSEPHTLAKSMLRVAFLVGVLAVISGISWPYPLLSGQWMTVGMLLLCVCVGLVIFGVPRDVGIAAKDLLLVFLPWFLAAALFANGAFDTSPETLHQTVILRTSYSRRARTLVVQSWRPGNSTESLSVSRGFFSHSGSSFSPGQSVTVGVRSGALGMPWVTRIAH